MRTEDKADFTKLLAATMAVYERQITSGFVDIFFSALGQYPLEVVREALNRHLQDPEGGRFAPKPADLIRQVVTAKASDGRPGRDEAWAIAQRSLDESETVVTSEEILEAMAIARPLLVELNDKVAARMAFVEAYDRIVGVKRATGEKFEWFVSLGDDKSRRAPAIEAARVAGLLPGPKAMALLEMHRETPITSDGLAIAGLIGSSAEKAKPEDLRSKWQEIRKQIGKRAESKKNTRLEEMRAAEAELEKFAKNKKDSREEEPE